MELSPSRVVSSLSLTPSYPKLRRRENQFISSLRLIPRVVIINGFFRPCFERRVPLVPYFPVKFSHYYPLSCSPDGQFARNPIDGREILDSFFSRHLLCWVKPIANPRDLRQGNLASLDNQILMSSEFARIVFQAEIYWTAKAE